MKKIIAFLRARSAPLASSLAGAKRAFGIVSLLFLLVTFTWAGNIPNAMAATYTVKMGADNGMLQFEPSILTIQAGDTVKWINNKLAPHNTVFAKDRSPDLAGAKRAFGIAFSHKSLVFSLGESYETIFPNDTPAGEYDYYCEPHRGAGMMGKIIVQ
jgi:plastocyanin